MSNPGLGITRIRYNGCNLSQLWSSLNTALVSWRTSSAPLNGANIVKILLYTYLFIKKADNAYSSSALNLLKYPTTRHHQYAGVPPRIA